MAWFGGKASAFAPVALWGGRRGGFRGGRVMVFTLLSVAIIASAVQYLRKHETSLLEVAVSSSLLPDFNLVDYDFLMKNKELVDRKAFFIKHEAGTSCSFSFPVKANKTVLSQFRKARNLPGLGQGDGASMEATVNDIYNGKKSIDPSTTSLQYTFDEVAFDREKKALEQEVGDLLSQLEKARNTRANFGALGLGGVVEWDWKATAALVGVHEVDKDFLTRTASLATGLYGTPRAGRKRRVEIFFKNVGKYPKNEQSNRFSLELPYTREVPGDPPSTEELHDVWSAFQEVAKLTALARTLEPHLQKIEDGQVPKEVLQYTEKFQVDEEFLTQTFSKSPMNIELCREKALEDCVSLTVKPGSNVYNAFLNAKIAQPILVNFDMERDLQKISEGGFVDSSMLLGDLWYLLK